MFLVDGEIAPGKLIRPDSLKVSRVEVFAQVIVSAADERDAQQ